jgi:ribosomal protein L29
MEVKEMKKTTAANLLKVKRETEDELRSLRAALAAHQLSQVRKIRAAKKTIARIKTFLNQAK